MAKAAKAAEESKKAVEEQKKQAKEQLAKRLEAAKVSEKKKVEAALSRSSPEQQAKVTSGKYKSNLMMYPLNTPYQYP